MNPPSIFDIRKRVSSVRAHVFETLMEEGEKQNLSINELILVIAGILSQLAGDAVKFENKLDNDEMETDNEKP